MPENDATGISSSDYAIRSKQLLSLVNHLRGIGAQGELDLPRITVIGKQSAGKSSVVEAISGINVPRDAGTCTRCPMECRLSSSSGPWSCRVSIRREFDTSGKPLDEVSEQFFGVVITNKEEVEPRLRRAQFAVLNAHIPFSKVLSMPMEDIQKHSAQNKSKSFSRDVVCIDLQGPELTDLSFIDLPGLIQNAEPEEVQLVEDMVVSHIKGNCLILAALPVTDDIENQKALRLAQKEDPHGRRTIGVLTKPDMLSASSINARNMWLDILEGRTHPLKHGYYCTRQPDDLEREAGITTTEARAAEVAFFSHNPPWSNSLHRQRLGIGNLVKTLSNLLIQIINESLPEIHLQTSRHLESCREELGSLPPMIDMDPASYILTLLTHLCDNVQQYVRGSSDSSLLIHHNRDAYAIFKESIRLTTPNFIPFPDASHNNASILKSIAEGEEDAKELTGNMKPIYLNDMRKHIMKSVTRELPGNVPYQAKVAIIAATQNTWSSSVHACFNSIRASFLKVLLKCVDDNIKQYDLLRGTLTSFVTELVAKHYDSCLVFLDAILEVELTPYTQNFHYLESSSSKWLAKYKDVRSRLNEVKPTQKFSLTPSMPTAPSQSLPSQPPLFAFATKPSAFAFPRAPSVAPPSSPVPTSSSSSVEPTVKPFWNHPPLTPSAPNSALPEKTIDTEKINNALASLAEIGYVGLTKDDLGKLNPPDEYETELKVMAEVKGYFQVAYKRIIDNVPSLIDRMFIKAVGKELQPFLISKFELGTVAATARYSAYLAEDPNLVGRREELAARKKRLEKVQLELYNFGL